MSDIHDRLGAIMERKVRGGEYSLDSFNAGVSQREKRGRSTARSGGKPAGSRSCGRRVSRPIFCRFLSKLFFKCHNIIQPIPPPNAKRPILLNLSHRSSCNVLVLPVTDVLLVIHLRVNFWPVITGAAAVDLEFALPHMEQAIMNQLWR